MDGGARMFLEGLPGAYAASAPATTAAEAVAAAPPPFPPFSGASAGAAMAGYILCLTREASLEAWNWLGNKRRGKFFTGRERERVKKKTKNR